MARRFQASPRGRGIMADSLTKRQSKKETVLRKLDERERLARFKRDFLADLKADKKWRDAKAEAGDFYDGYQWTEEEKSILKARNQPAVVINRIKPKIDGLIGIQLAARVDTKAYAQGDTEAEIEALSEQIRKIEDYTEFDQKETKAFTDICIEGRSWYWVKKCWDGLRKYWKIEKPSNDDVIKDLNSREMDLSDAKRVHHTVWVDVDDAAAMFPKRKKEIEENSTSPDFLDGEAILEHHRVKPDQYRAKLGGSVPDEAFESFCDEANKRIRVVTTYYRTNEIKKFYVHKDMKNADGVSEPLDITDMAEADLNLVKTTYPNGTILNEVRKILNHYTFTWNTELEWQTDTRPDDREAKFPFIMMYAYAERRDGTHYGFVRQHIDPQVEYNKRRSKLLHLLNVNSVRYLKGAFEDPEKARAEFQKPDGFIEIEPSFANGVTVEKNLDVSATQFQLLQQAAMEIDGVGAAKEVEGKSSANSGKELQLRQQLAQQPTRAPFDAARDGRRRTFQYVLEDQISELGPEFQDLKFDVVVEEAPDTISQNSEVFEKMVSLAQAGLPIPMEWIMAVSPIPKVLREQLPQQNQGQVPAAPQGATEKPAGAVA